VRSEKTQDPKSPTRVCRIVISIPSYLGKIRRKDLKNARRKKKERAMGKCVWLA
jgi:hypothetical protein